MLLKDFLPYQSKQTRKVKELQTQVEGDLIASVLIEEHLEE